VNVIYLTATSDADTTHLSRFSFADIATCKQDIDKLINLYVRILVHKTLQTHRHHVIAGIISLPQGYWYDRTAGIMGLSPLPSLKFRRPMITEDRMKYGWGQCFELILHALTCEVMLLRQWTYQATSIPLLPRHIGSKAKLTTSKVTNYQEDSCN